MRVSLHLAYWGVGPGPEELVPFGRSAEAHGFDTLWVGEAYGSECASCLTWLAAHTETIRLASGVAQMPARTPAATAMMAMTIDTLSGGRFRLGLGPSGPQVSEGWHGVTFNPQLKRMREYAEVVRRALRREPLAFDGDTISLPGGNQRSIKLMFAPVQEQLEIYLPAIGPNATALVGEVADGWMPLFFAPEHIETLRARLDEGVRAAGRPDGDVAVAPVIYARVEDDAGAARDAVRAVTALYVGGMGSREKNFYNAQVRRYGFDDAAAEVQDLYLDGRKEEAAAALPADLLDLITLCGPVEQVAERLQAYERAGVDELVISITARGSEDRLTQLDRLAAAVDRAGLAGKV